MTPGNRRLTRKLLVVTIVMFAFGYALVPLYQVMCQITGINGKTGRLDAKAMAEMPVDKNRWVTVEFTTSVNQGMPWEFRPAVTSMRVHPGEINTTTFYARNLVDVPIVGQAIPSVVPVSAAAHFKKLECFCFSRQELKAHEAKVMPVRYVVQPDLPPDVKTIVLSYTFFNTDKDSARHFGGDVASAQPLTAEVHHH